jgi:hypothetical protein
MIKALNLNGTVLRGQRIQEVKANSKHLVILATKGWLLIYCSPLIQFYNKTLTERKLISNKKETNLKDPNKLGRKSSYVEGGF